MNPKLQSLHRLLISAGQLDCAEIVKTAFINDAKILYGYGDGGSPRVRLIGKIKDRDMTFGGMNSYRLPTEQNLFQIHRQVDHEYLGLGYGEEMLAVMAKLAQINDGNIAIIPWGGSIETNNAVKSIKSMIRGRGGIEIVPICMLQMEDLKEEEESEEDLGRPIVFKRKDIELVAPKIAGITTGMIKKLKETFKRVDLSENVYHFDGMTYSVGYIIKNVGAKISLPVQLEQEQQTTDDREQREADWDLKDQRAKDVKYIRNPGLKEKEEREEYGHMMRYLDSDPSLFLNCYGYGKKPYIDHPELADGAFEKALAEAINDSRYPSEAKYLARVISEYPTLHKYQERLTEAMRQKDKISEPA